MTTREEIYHANRTELSTIYNTLVVEKMRLDRFFTVFLDANELDAEDTSTPEWVTYREMTRTYDLTSSLLTYAQYRMKQTA